MRRLLPRRPRSLRSQLLTGILLVVVIVVVWTVVAALLARHDLDAARKEIQQLQSSTPSNLGALDASVSRARQLADAAASDTGQPGPWLFRHLPLVGRSVEAEHVIAEAAGGLLGSIQPVLTDAEALHHGPAGGIDLSTLGRLQGDLAAAPSANAGVIRQLRSLDFGATPSFVSGQGRQAVNQVVDAVNGLGQAARAVGAVHGILGGSGKRTVMVALENNAELRGTGGLVSSFALGTADDGQLRLGKFRDTNQLAVQPEQAQKVPAPATYASAYGQFLANSTLWRNANMSADVPQSATVMSELMQRSLHVRPDVIIFVDVPAVADIIDSTGQPLLLPDGQDVKGRALVNALLLQSYGKATYNAAVEARRKELLNATAGRAFAAISSQQPSLSLLRALATAAGQRHILVWSARPTEEDALTAAGVSGAVRPGDDDIAMVVDQDLGSGVGYGNKLDYYIDRRVKVTAVVDRTEASVSETVTLSNHTPKGLGPYIVGISHPGRLTELVGIALPGNATIDGFTSAGANVPSQNLAADGAREVRTIATLDAGESKTWDLRYSMPVTDGHFTLLGVPQPLAEPATLQVSVAPAGQNHLVGLGSTVVQDGRVTRSGPWTGQVTMHVAVEGPSWWTRLRHDFDDFWNHRV